MHTTGSANSEADEARSNVSGTHGGCDARSERHVKCIAKRALRNAFVPALLSLAVTDPAVAQSTAAPNPPPPACAAAEHRQFDFWIGDWEVRDPQGTEWGVKTGLEAQFRDGATGAILGECADTQIGLKYAADLNKGTATAAEAWMNGYASSFTSWSYAQDAFNKWSSAFARRLAELRAQSPQ